MKLALAADMPVGLWTTDNNSDYSGYGNTAVITGTPVGRHTSLTPGASYAQILSSAGATMTFDTVARNIYTLECWALPFGDQKILTTNGTNGLTVVAGILFFKTEYSTAPAAVCSTLIPNGKLYIVAIHTKNKNSLYLNGVLVSSVDLTAAQQADTMVTGAWVAGNATAALALGAVAIYATALPQEKIKSHYVLSQMPDQLTVMTEYGHTSELALDATKSYSHTITGKEWRGGYYQNIDVVNGTLVCYNGSGSWIGVLPLDQTDETAINSVSFEWEGTGTVQVSLDRTTWETITYGQKITTVTAGTNPFRLDLFIKILMNADDTFTSLTGNILINNTFIDYNGAISGTGTVRPYIDPTQFNSLYGFKGTFLSVGTDSGARPNAVSFWINPTSYTTSLTGTVYVNGVAGSVTTGRWQLVTVVQSTITSFTITGDFVMGPMLFHPTTLTSTDVLNVYNNFMNNKSVRISDTHATNFDYNGVVSTIYSYDWAITGSSSF